MAVRLKRRRRGEDGSDAASLMYAKLNVHDRAQAILYALHKGLAA